MTSPITPLAGLRGAINQFQSIDRIPLSLLKSMGFSSVNQAKLAAQQAGINMYPGTPNQQVSNSGIGKVISGAGNVLLDLLKGANEITTGTGLPQKTTPGLPGQLSGFVPKGLPGSGLNYDLTPAAGGANYGQPAGSTLGVAHGTPAPQPFSQSTYDEQVPQGSNTPITYGSNADNLPDSGTAPDWNTYMNGYGSGTSYAPIPIAPKPTPLVMNDFTPQATKDASQAYSPAFQAIEQAKTDAQNNYNVSNAIVGGIYKDLGTTIGSNFDALDTKMNATKTSMQNDQKAAQGQIADTYGAAGTQMADELKRQGLGQYAASVMQPSNDQLAFQSGQLAQQGLNATNTLDANKATGDTYGTNLQNASATQGAFSQQQLAFDLASTLSGFSQDKLNLSTDEANRILDLANTLSGQDLSLQQGNNSQQQQYYQNQLGAAEAQNSQVNTGLQQDYQQRQDAYNAATSAYNNNVNWALQQQQINNQNSQASASLNEDWAKAGLSAQSAAANAAAQGGPSYNNLSPSEKFQDTVTRLMTTTQNGVPTAPTTTQVQPYTDVINGVLNTYRTQGTFGTKNVQQFIQDVITNATANHLDQNVAQAIAYAAADSGLVSGITGATALGPLSTN